MKSGFLGSWKKVRERLYTAVALKDSKSGVFLWLKRQGLDLKEAKEARIFKEILKDSDLVHWEDLEGSGGEGGGRGDRDGEHM